MKCDYNFLMISVTNYKNRIGKNIFNKKELQKWAIITEIGQVLQKFRDFCNSHFPLLSPF